MRILRLIGIAILAACFSPDELDGSLVCGPAPDVCPPDFTCMDDNHCWRAGGPPSIDAPVAPVDAPIAAPADAPVAGPDAHIPACSDGIDNDCDGLIDWPADPGCSSPDDDDEHGTNECDDGIDNDHDGKTDFHIGKACGPGDDKCKSPFGTSEH